MVDKKRRPPAYAPPGCTLVELRFGEWAVMRRSITRADANRLREALWAVGIYPNMPTTEFDAEQWKAWEEDWAQRIVLYTKDWSLLREDGTPLPIERASVEEMEDPVYQRFCTRINELIAGRSDEDAKSAQSDGKRVGEGDEAGGGTTGEPEVLPASTPVGKIPAAAVA